MKDILRIDGLGLSILVSISEGLINSIQVVDRMKSALDSGLELKYRDIYSQFKEYLEGKKIRFSVPLKMENLTEFQKIVFLKLNQIPFGEVVSYEELAKRTKGISYRRAVGTALAHNPFPVIIPCHRVVPKHFSFNKLGGYSEGIEIKKRLLIHENPGLFLNLIRQDKNG